MFCFMEFNMAGIISTLIGAGASAYNTNKTNEANQAIATATNQANERMNQANIEYQKELNQQIFEREDTSYQRTVQDMINAGLSPSSMGSTNGSGGTVSSPANSFGAVGYEAQRNQVGEILAQSDGILNTLAKGVEIQNMKAEGDYIRAKTEFENPANRYRSYLSAIASGLDKDSSDYKNLMKIMDFMDSRLQSLLPGGNFGFVSDGNFSNDSVKNTSENITENVLNTVGSALGGVANGVGDVIAPQVEKATSWVSEKANSLIDKIQAYKDSRSAQKKANASRKAFEKSVKKAGKERDKQIKARKTYSHLDNYKNPWDY